MDQITNEIRNKIKLAVKAKLQEIGAYVDEELPDYIMVMIANRRSKVQMNSELSLFLGNHTEKFTDWLHSVLERLEAFAISSNTSDTLKAAVSSLPKSSATPSFALSGKVEETEMNLVSNSSTLPSNLNNVNETVKSHSQDTFICSQNIQQRNSPNVLETKDILYVPMPISQIPRTSLCQQINAEVDLDDIDCLNIREEVDQECHIEEKLTRKRLPSPFSVKDRRPKRRHGSATDEREMRRSNRENNNRRSPGRCVGGSHDSRRQGSRLSSRLRSVVRPALQSQVAVVKQMEHRPKENRKEDKFEKDDDNNRNGVNSVVKVTARRRLPTRLQPTNSLILKAVAEAQKSIASRPIKASEGEPQPKPVLFTRKFRERNRHVTTVIDSSQNIQSQMALKQEEDVKLEEMEVEEQFVDSDFTQPQIPDIYDVPLADQTEIIETRFVVTLDGAHSVMSRMYEDDGNEDDNEGDIGELVLNTEQLRKPVKSRLFRRRSTGSEMETTQQPLERCKFWPNCRQGDRCSFHHPKTPCKTFPNCSFGDSCLFIHPPCKFDGTCTRRMCPFVHIRPKSSVAVPPVTLKPVIAPVKSAPPAINGKLVCKFFPACNNVSCTFFHPAACKYGSNCTRAGCTFHHPKSRIPGKNKLKWAASIKTK